MKRLLIFLAVFTVISSLFTLCAFAEDSDNSQLDSPIESNDEYIAEEDVLDTPAAKEDESKNVFEIIYDKIALYASEIFSALALIGSLVISFTYKKGLLPTVSTALSGIGGAVGELRKENDEWKITNEKVFSEVSNKLLAAEQMFSKLSAALKKLEADLNENREEAMRTRDMRTVMLSQIDMLYTIFMSSGLPVYQKDEISEKVRKMKEALIGEEAQNEQE